MIKSHLFRPITGLLLMLGIILFSASCKDDDDTQFDNSLMVLSQTIDGEEFEDEIEGISQIPSIEFIFSHTLDMQAFESAFSFVGPGGEVAFSIEYSNTNSTVTITPDEELEYDRIYDLSLPNGPYGAEGEQLTTPLILSFKTAPFVPANVTMTTDKTTLNEEPDTATLTFELNMTVNDDVTVNLGFSGDATPDVDFMAANSVVIPAGETMITTTVITIQDGDIEGTETIEIAIDDVVNAELLSPQMVSIMILDDDIDSNGDGFPDQGFIINEVLFDPPSGDAGDANGDGTRSPSEDEFIEFVNDSDIEVDLSGFTLYDENNLATLEPRHTFPEGTIIPPGGIYVLFGGGNPSGDFGTAEVAVSTTGNMNLSNADDIITILDKDMNVFLTFDTQDEGAGISFGEDQAVTRNPDINGDFELHLMVNPDLAFSPGKRADGTNFDGSVDPGEGFIINEVLFDPPSGAAGDANGDGTRSPSEDEFIEFINDSDLAVDLSGFRLFDETALGNNEPRHVFPDGTVIPPGGVYVLFGGGMPMGAFGGAQVGTSTTGNMNLSNAGDIITILDPMDNVFLTFDTAIEGAGLDFGSDQSITRSPDIEGMYMLHTTANPGLDYSPGTRTDGSNF